MSKQNSSSSYYALRSVHNNLNDQKIGNFKYDTESVYLIAKPKAKTKCVTIIALDDK